MSDYIDDIVAAYENGLPGWQYDERTMDNLFADDLVGTFDAECPHLAGVGAGKRAMLWRSRDLYDPGAFGQEKQTTGDCFVAGTPVLGPTTKPIERVRVGDAVWSGNGKLTTVVSTRCISTRKPLLRISLHGMLPIVCTPDHKLCACYALAGTAEVETKLVPACELNVGDRLHLPDTFALPTAEWPEWLHDTPDVRWLVGALLGNGYVGQGMIELWSAKPHVLERATEAMLSLGISAIRRTTRRGATRIRACCKWLAALLRAELYDGKQKTAKPWMYRAEVVEGLLDTDGTSHGDRRMFDNTAPALTWLVYVMIQHSGYRPCVSRLARSAGTYANAKPLYRVHWLARERRRDYWQGGARIRRIDVLETSEPIVVYDIGVADATHTFAAGGVAVSNCVSHGSRNARDTTRAVEIHIKGEPEIYFKRGATEPTYGARGHGGQGMDPARAARFEVEYGFLFRQNYPGVVDLSVYNSSIGARWGSTGVPQAVKELCKQHNVGRWIAPRTPEQARDLLAAGYAIHSGQSWGCKARSDQRGIAITGSPWNHDMATVGVDDTKEIYPVTVFLVVNSWGSNWNQKPYVWPDEILGPWPPGSFWVDIDTYGRYFVGSRSIFAYCDIKGVPAKNLPDWGNLAPILG